MIRALACVAASLLVGCGSPPDVAVEHEAEPPASPVVRPTIELAGCRHLDGDRCHLRAEVDESLHLWVDVHARAPLRVAFDGVEVDVETVAVDGGQRLNLVVPATAELLTIVGVEPAWSDGFELRFVRERVPRLVIDAEAHSPEVGVAQLREAATKLDARERLATLQALRRALLHVDVQAAKQAAREAMELARELGRSRDFADCASALAGFALNEHDFAAARQWTKQLAEVADTLPEARVWSLFYSGTLAIRVGDLGAAARDLEAACRLAQRLGMDRLLLGAREQLAQVLAELGRARESLEVLRELVAQARAPGVDCSDRARALGNAAWSHLLLAEAGHDHDAPRPLLEEQLAAVSEHGECPNSRSLALLNLAIVALADHEPEEAWDWIGVQIVNGVPRGIQAWIDEVSAQVGVATGREELIPALVRRPAPAGAEPGLRWMAAVRHARTLEALGLHDAAIASYLDAEAVLEELFDSVGVDYGAELFLAGRLASAEGLVDLLVRGGEVEQAFCRARVARGRALRTVDRTAKIAALSPAQRERREQLLYEFLDLQAALALERREDWKFSAPEREHRERRRGERAAEGEQVLDEALRIIGNRKGAPRCDELPAIAPGEVAILQFPRPGPEGGSWIFVADGERVEAREVADADLRDQGRSSSVLEPFAERLARAQLIRVMPTNSGWALPFHALPLAEGVLLDAAPVVYSLDLPARERTVERGASALVVANPSDDLRHAREEAEQVVERLTEAGWAVVHHAGAEATRARVADSLGRATLLHYAGHGTHAGPDGWAAALVLHEGERLTVSDILALPRVPEAVVLSGCDTATVAEATVAGGMNLGRAFVLAGSSWVIAAEGRVDDELARAIGVALYEHADGSMSARAADGAEALRRAQRHLRADYPSAWRAFRIVVP